jgi:Peptidase S46
MIAERFTFTSGHPGRTHRLDTVAQLAFERDVTLPRSIFYNSELRGMLVQFSVTGAEQTRMRCGSAARSNCNRWRPARLQLGCRILDWRPRRASA